MKVEPKYIHKRHENLRASSPEPAAPEEPAEAADEAPADDDGSDEGGDE